MAKRKTGQRVDSKRMRRFRWFLISGIVLLTCLGLILGFLTFERSVTRSGLPPLKLTVSSSKFLSANEDEIIVLGMENMDSNKVDVEFRLENEGVVPVHMGLAASNAFYLGQVSAGEQVNRQVNVNFPCSFSQVLEVVNQEAGLSLWGGLKATQIKKVKDLPLMIGPIPWARRLFTVTSSLFGVLVSFLIFEVVWEKVKTAKK